MKNKIFTFVLLLIFVFSFSVSAFAQLYVEYSPDKRGVLVLSDDPINAGDYFSINIGNGEFSLTNPPKVSWILAAKENPDEPYFVSLLHLPVGKYTLTYASATIGNLERQKDFIVYDLDSTEVLSMINLLNQKTTPSAFVSYMHEGNNMLLVGIDADTQAYVDDILKMCFYLKSFMDDSKYIPITFTDAYRYAKAVVTMQKTSKYDDNMKLYSDCFESTYEDYESLSDNVKQGVNDIISNLTGEEGFMTIGQMALLSKIKTSLTHVALKNYVLDNSDELGINIEKGSPYSQIKEENKYKVFNKMFDERGSYASIEDVKKGFASACTVVLKEQSKPKDEGGSLGDSTHNSSSNDDVSSSVSYPTSSPDTNYLNDIYGHYAQNEIVSLMEKGVISGYSDNTFKPSNNVTRAEFCKMVCLAFNISSSDTLQTFNDVTPFDWYYSYVLNMSQNGLVNGYMGNFNPNQTITRQDAALILYRVLTMKGISLSGNFEFSDESEISAYAKQAVSLMASKGYVKGYNGNFSPLSSITRADSAIMISRICAEVN